MLHLIVLGIFCLLSPNIRSLSRNEAVAHANVYLRKSRCDNAFAQLTAADVQRFILSAPGADDTDSSYFGVQFPKRIHKADVELLLRMRCDEERRVMAIHEVIIDPLFLEDIEYPSKRRMVRECIEQLASRSDLTLDPKPLTNWAHGRYWLCIFNNYN
eukprot:scaffold4096_cov237-Pinguiococcus_pyrenoidosus.AAC.4